MNELYGIEYRDIISIIQLITNRAEKISDWQVVRDIAIFSDNIGGVPLKVRYDLFKEKSVSLSGDGWLVSFSVSTRRNDSMPTMTRSYNISYPRRSKTFPDKRLEIHKTTRYVYDPTILSPDSFRHDMSILMLFSSEWE